MKTCYSITEVKTLLQDGYRILSYGMAFGVFTVSLVKG